MQFHLVRTHTVGNHNRPFFININGGFLFCYCYYENATRRHKVALETKKFNMHQLNYQIDCRLNLNVDLDPIKVQPEWHICTHENTWLRKVSWGPLQWTWCDPYVGKEVKPSLPSNLRLDWVARF